jgi:conjugative relaxase-like TrwC/TraI family protein
MAVATAAKIQANTPRGIANVTAYMTVGVKMAMGELSKEDRSLLAGYYASPEHGPRDVTAQARWVGGGCAALGLVEGAVVDAAAVEKLLDHRNPATGEKLAGRAQIQAIDVTVSHEKDGGILMMLGGATVAERLLSAQQKGMAAGISYLQEEAAVVRRGAQGLVHKQSSGFVAVVVDHLTARPVEGKTAGSLHTHGLIINTGQGPDGKWTALDGERIFKHQAATGAVAGQITREQIAQDFGVTWLFNAGKGNRGVWGIAGIDEALRQSMSPRSRQILTDVLEAGLNPEDRSQWAQAQRSTREGKHTCGSGSAEEFAWAV